MKQGLLAIFRAFGRLFIDFTLHVLFIAHPRLNRKVSFGGLWDARSFDRFFSASPPLYLAIPYCSIRAASMLHIAPSKRRDCAGYKRNVRANCVLSSKHLIPLGETPVTSYTLISR
jgi:hypothetical protein